MVLNILCDDGLNISCLSPEFLLMFLKAFKNVKIHIDEFSNKNTTCKM